MLKYIKTDEKQIFQLKYYPLNFYGFQTFVVHDYYDVSIISIS